LEGQAVSLIANQLQLDKTHMDDTVTLCGKFAPREKGPFDRQHQAATKIAKALGVSLPQYRKQYLTPLKAKLRLVERDMCAKEFEKIDYSRVPSIAGSNYSDAFKKHDGERYSAYLESVKKGESKMNTAVLMPHQIIAPYLKRGELNETQEAQWKSFVDNRRQKWPVGLDVLPLVDVSGSMQTGRSPAPLEVAVSLGLLLSELNSSSAYRGKFITFHEIPQLLKIPEGTLKDKVKYMHDSKWGGSTNVRKAFDLILDLAVVMKVPQENMPKVLLILSDMQFNRADGGKTNFVALAQKYRTAGYQLPVVVYWNLNGTIMDYPVPSADHPGVILLSGYNDVILYSLMDATLPNPRDIVHKALDAQRYSCIEL
jgi:Mg-chelatase subunit ChlD